MNILLGITSGISIYKTLSVIRKLVKEGHQIKVIMTENASELINPLLFKTLSGNEVYVQDFDIRTPLAHIQLGDWADLSVVIPATANTVAKLANGIADNLLTSTFLACDKKKIVFPAMNVKMFENQATQNNLQLLKDRGYEIIEPAYGDLACGYRGKGRLPAEDYIIGIINRDPAQPLKGRNFIVTAGGTVEKIDPVRSISNSSSGKMGIEIAKYLYKSGAGVLLVYGNVTVPVPSYFPSLPVQSAEDMLFALERNMTSYDGLYMAAAPADFRAAQISLSKIKKSDSLTIKLVKNPDIIKEITGQFPDKLYVGFALETENSMKNAEEKLKNKNLDFIALNTISKDFNPLGNDQNSITLLSRKGVSKELKEKQKKEIAEWLVHETLCGLE